MGTKYHLILISNEQATAYMNIHLFRCKQCGVIKFDQFLLIFARFLAIFSFDFENSVIALDLDKLLTNGKRRLFCLSRRAIKLLSKISFHIHFKGKIKA